VRKYVQYIEVEENDVDIIFHCKFWVASVVSGVYGTVGRAVDRRLLQEASLAANNICGSVIAAGPIPVDESPASCRLTLCSECRRSRLLGGVLKAKFHYASWFGASSKLAPNLLRTCSEPAPNQLA